LKNNKTMTEKRLNEKESLELIIRMIRNTQQNIGVGNGNQFIVWGVSILAVSLIYVVLDIMTTNMPINFVWFFIPVFGYIWNKAITKNEKVFTHMDKLLKLTWGVCGVLCISTPIIIILINHFASEFLIFSVGSFFSIIPIVEIIIVSIGISVSGVILNSKYIIIAGIVGFAISFFTQLRIPHIIPIAYALWSLTCLIIPGLILKYKTK